MFKEPDGLSLGPGPFVLALEHATGRTARVGQALQLGECQAPWRDCSGMLPWHTVPCQDRHGVRCPTSPVCFCSLDRQVVGKPEASFFQLALSDVGCQPQEAVMIGGQLSWMARLPLLRHPAPALNRLELAGAATGAKQWAATPCRWLYLQAMICGMMWAARRRQGCKAS